MLAPLKELSKREAERRKRSDDTQQELGLSQAFELGERSNIECVFLIYARAMLTYGFQSVRREKISNIERDILKLASKLEISVGRPPSQKDHDPVQSLIGGS